MKQCKGRINKIETFGLVDGPGIRTVIFLNGCKLRCKFCHNPETWNKIEENYTVDELVNKILRSKPYFKDNGGVTFSGGEPLLQKDFLIEVCKKLKEENIHIALDTSGIGLDNNNKELLDLVDLVLLDIKSITREGYKDITQTDNFDNFEEFIKELNNSNKEVWIRQVIIPNINDNIEYINNLSKYLKKIKNITKIEPLPFHTMGFSKYQELNINNPYSNIEAMDKEKCDYLYTVLVEKNKEEN